MIIGSQLESMTDRLVRMEDFDVLSLTLGIFLHITS